MLLQLLICEINAQLLKTVDLEALEPIDIEHPDYAFSVRILTDGVVNLVHNPAMKVSNWQLCRISSLSFCFLNFNHFLSMFSTNASFLSCHISSCYASR